MEGEGPGKRGKPRRLDVLIAGSDAFAVDATVCKMLGIDPDSVPILKAARGMSLLNENIDIEGTLPAIGDFLLPKISPLIYGPQWMHGFIRRQILQRPVCDGELCQECGKCWEFCPAGAITPARRSIDFDYERCIRCYCCLEVCPAGAVHVVEPLAGRLVRRFMF